MRTSPFPAKFDGNPVLFFGEGHFVSQLLKPLLVLWQSRGVQLFGRVEPLVGKPRFRELGPVRFHPLFVTCPRADLVPGVQKLKHRHRHVQDFALFVGHNIAGLQDVGHKILLDQFQIIVS